MGGILNVLANLIQSIQKKRFSLRTTVSAPHQNGPNGPNAPQLAVSASNLDLATSRTGWGTRSAPTWKLVSIDSRILQVFNNLLSDERQKCMGPPCGDEVQERPDPMCPVSDWSDWSPCSASCGKGVRFRTRLLLVEPGLQQKCSTRLEIMQQSPCMITADCTFNMAVAKGMHALNVFNVRSSGLTPWLLAYSYTPLA